MSWPWSWSGFLVVVVLCGTTVCLDNRQRLMYYDAENDSNSSFGAVLEKRFEDKDVFYVLLGHSNSTSASKRQFDNFNFVHRLFQSLRLPTKAVTLNTDLADTSAEHSHNHDSYMGSSEWLVDYTAQQLGVTWDQPATGATGNFDYLGVVAHAWHDCIGTPADHSVGCIRVLQVRNLAKFYPDTLPIERLSAVFVWMRAQMNKHPEPTLVAFQQFDAGRAPLLRELSDGVAAPADNVVAVVFGMSAGDGDGATLRRTLCRGLGSRPAPVLSLDELAEDDYLILQLGTTASRAKHVYRVSPRNSTTTLVSDLPAFQYPCI